MYQERIALDSGAAESKKASAPVDQAAPGSFESMRPIAEEVLKTPRRSSSDTESLFKGNETSFYPSHHQTPPALLQRIRLGLQRLLLLCRGSFRQCARWVTGGSIESTKNEL